MIQLGPVRDSQHDPNAATIKKGHVRRRLKEKRHAQDVPVKGDRSIQVLHVNEDLAYLIKGWPDRDRGTHVVSLSKFQRLSYSMPADVLSTFFLLIIL